MLVILTSSSMSAGLVMSSQAMLARFFSPPDSPGINSPPMTVEKRSEQHTVLYYSV